MRREFSTQQDTSERDRGSLLEDALCSITRFSSERSWFTLILLVILAVASVGYTVRSITFKTNRSDLIDPSAPFHQRWIQYTQTFGDDSDLIVVFEGDNPETIKKALDDLAERMEREADLFTNFLYKVEPRRLREKGLQYLSPVQLEAGLNELRRFRPIIQGNWDLLRLDTLFARFRYQISDRGRADSSEDLQPLLDQALLLTRSMNRSLDNPDDFSSPWPNIISGDGTVQDESDEVVYLINEQGTMGFLKAFSIGNRDDFTGATQSIDRLRKLVDEVSVSYPGLQIGITGIPVLENDEMRRSQADMLKASLISFVGVGLLLILGFRGFRHPMLGMFMLAVGMAWAFGYTTFIVGHLNILSVSFAVILIGLGIDFGIHYMARYLELRHDGRSLQRALEKTSAGVGTGIVTAAVTTAMAFFCATLTQFLGVTELGIIAGGGILLCALATFLVLPALISIADRDIEPRKLPTPFQTNLLRRMTSRFPSFTAVISVAVMLVVGGLALKWENGRIEPNIRYDSNLLNLQAEGLAAVDLQKRIFQNADDSLLFAVSIANSPEEARSLRKQFESLASVERVEELASHLPAYSAEETKLLVQAYQAELSQLPDRLPKQEMTPDPAVVGLAMEQLHEILRDSREPAVVNLVQNLDLFLDKFDILSLERQQQFFTDYQYRMSADLLRRLQKLNAASNPDPVVVSDLPAELRSRFISSQGKWLLQIYPTEQIWDVKPLSRFVSDVRSIDPEATGTPLQNYEASGQIKESYQAAALYALVAISLVLLVDFLHPKYKLLVLLPPAAVVAFAALTLYTRRADFDPLLLVSTYLAMIVVIAAILDFRNLRDVLLTLAPPLGGGVLMFGILAYWGIDLNPANLIVLPLVLGIGVDDGVHVVHDFRMQTGRYRPSSSTINAVLLTSLTSMIGFGSLMVAAHRGLYSVGLVLVVGIGSCLFVSLVTLPAILTLVSRTRIEPKKPHIEKHSDEKAVLGKHPV
jgi:hopanoid biosynthesis associated RND transporter like protein HpnN